MNPTFTNYYLRKIQESLIDKLMERGKWMTQAEVERMHQVSYRGGMFIVRRQDSRWFVSWDNQNKDNRLRIAHRAGKAVVAFEKVRREVDMKLDFMA